jgi:hypothetical protein
MRSYRLFYRLLGSWLLSIRHLGRATESVKARTPLLVHTSSTLSACRMWMSGPWVLFMSFRLKEGRGDSHSLIESWSDLESPDLLGQHLGKFVVNVVTTVQLCLMSLKS